MNDKGSVTNASAHSGWSNRLMAPPVLFTLLGLLGLVLIWGATFNLVASEKASADRAAAALAADVADTYEARVLRALREIDQALKLVRYQLEDRSAETVLRDLGDRNLLPPGFLFTISVIDSGGDVIASTREHVDDVVVSSEILQRARETDSMAIGRPHRDRGTGEWKLHFARTLEEDPGTAGGIVNISVHAGYFVSGYEADALGEKGVLGIMGTDGIFRARRTGDTLSAGEEVDYSSLISDDSGAAPVSVRRNSWDDTRRYTRIKELYEFPLAVVVGLSETEQLAEAARLEAVYMLRAGAASALLLGVIALLGRLSGRLEQARRRVAEERIDHAKRVEYLAFHDNLTELPNRALFSQLLAQGMEQARRNDRCLALLFLDLDRFKLINDSLGHDAGDGLLKEVASRLRGAVRKSDVVARLGGDEFVVLLPEIDHGTRVARVAEKILAATSRPFTLVGQEFRVTVSIGVAVFPDDGEDEESLMKNADVAMYHAKEQGKNNFQYYSEELNTNSLERLALESSLRRALENDEFRLYYQAKRNMNDGTITGVEALLRWEHPDLGLVSPMQFIPLAEENGLIVPIGRWVFRTACRQNVAWQKEGYPQISMAINLSARQFIDESLLDDVRLALNDSGMDPRLLEVEITESMIMHDMKKTIRVLESLKEMGVRVAIDDFGTGYSSLSTLKQFPLDTIKIDRSFIRDVAHSMEDKGLTEAIIAVGRSLSLTVVAEGVENADQFNYLQSHSCDEFQGYYSNEPMPAERFIRTVCAKGGGRKNRNSA